MVSLARAKPGRKIPEGHDLELSYPNVLTFDQLPPNGNPSGEWAYIGTIVESLSFWRPMYLVRDADGVIILIAFHIDRGAPLEQALSQIPSGSMMSMRRATQYTFMDGQEGFRIENKDLYFIDFTLQHEEIHRNQ